ncbi:MAG: phenylalanine--tRNA ligase subunit alpha [Spirochaetota bacterium]
MKEKLEDILKTALTGIESAKTAEDIENLRINVLGRKGELTGILRSLGSLPPAEKGIVGKRSNEIKKIIESALDEKKAALSEVSADQLAKGEWLDVTLNTPKLFAGQGRMHILSQVQYEIEDIFSSMGFMIIDGPEAEIEYYNFEALNIPKHHPARDMQDTFWTEDGNLLRTQTSAIQIRAMEKHTPPFKMVGPGRVFRYEAVDASHEHTFHQIEGMMVDKEISVSNLIYIMKEFLSAIFKKQAVVRLRPSYYPFVEPGFDLDFQCMICGGKGCKVCKNNGWIEFLGCGLVHPNVLRAGKIDPDKWSGFAFGMGLERLVMMRYGINDIRHFQSGDLRFLSQF